MAEKKKLELYIHIPFCERKCDYCDFLSAHASDGKKRVYVNQLVSEIRTQGALYTDYQVCTIFIGGGTPSVMRGIHISNILSAVYESFIVEARAEISIECNPGTLSLDKLSLYKQSGINRISFGLQSTNDEELKALGRIHTYTDFLRSYQMARQVGFDNINIDLMSAIPFQTVESYKSSLKNICMLKPEHISAYSLIIEEGTPFFETYGGGKEHADLPGEDADRRMYHLTKEILATYGYERYEISNYAKKGAYCRHNIGYWTDVEYLGLGLGASSYLMNRRFHVEEDMEAYLTIEMERDVTPLYQDIHELSKKEQMEEFVFLGLRLTKGVSSIDFFEKFGYNLFHVFDHAIQRNIDLKLLEFKPPYLRLTEQGLDVSNMVMSDFLL